MKISQKKAKEIIDNAEVIIIDVRTKEEYEQGHIQNAVLIPDFELKDKAEKIIKNKSIKILIYCQSGIRSSAAEKLLIYMGYENVYDFGGIIDWPYGIDKI